MDGLIDCVLTIVVNKYE